MEWLSDIPEGTVGHIFVPSIIFLPVVTILEPGSFPVENAVYGDISHKS